VTELCTDTGVTVRVNDLTASPWPDEAPEREPEAPPSIPRVVVRPPAGAHREHDAAMKRLFEEHGEFILSTFRRLRGNVVEESTRDLAQEVLILLHKRLSLGELHENVRGFLVDTIEHELQNHRRRWKPDCDRDADALEEPSPETGPEGRVAVAEERRLLEGWIEALPEKHAEAIRCFALEEMSLEEAGTALGRKPGTVAVHVARGKEKLRELARGARPPSEAPPR
jgi:RNA polymerase sigma factor (sigma-70 family)